VALCGNDGKWIQSTGRVAGSALRVFKTLCQRHVLTLGEARRRTGLAFPTVSRDMEVLTGLGIAREITGRKRDRVFAYDAYLSILNEGAEPLRVGRGRARKRLDFPIRRRKNAAAQGA
jgi:DNA-binding transcriptional ArsR family regulator